MAEKHELRGLRDVLTLTVGGSLCLSQIIVQQQGAEPNIAMLTAGVSLLVGYPLTKLGDHRTDSQDGGA